MNSRSCDDFNFNLLILDILRARKDVAVTILKTGNNSNNSLCIIM